MMPPLIKHIYMIAILLISIIHVVLSLESLKIAGLFPLFLQDGSIDNTVVQHIFSFVTAVNDINSKVDGIFDSLLPNTNLSYVLKGFKSSYAWESKAANEIANEVLNFEYISACVGATLKTTGKASSSQLSSSNVTLMSPGASNTSLNYNNGIPYFFRTIPAEQTQATALAKIIYQKHGIARISIISSVSDYGQSLSDEFQAIATSLQLTIASSHVLSSQSDIITALTLCKTYNAEIFVIFVSPSDALLLEVITEGTNLGLFTIDTEMFITEENQDILINYVASPSFNTNLYPMFQSIIFIQKSINFNRDLLQKFIQNWNLQLNNNNNKYKLCIMSTSRGTYNISLSQNMSTNNCQNVNYTLQKLTTNNFDPIIAYTYDATIAILLAQHHLNNNLNNNILNNTSIIGKNLKEILVNKKFSFLGASGYVSFYNNGNTNGDRHGELFYSLHALQYSSNTRNKLNLRRIGSWSSLYGLQDCIDDIIPTNDNNTGNCTSDWFAAIPYRTSVWDGYDTYRTELRTSTVITTNLFVAICLLVTIFFIWMILAFREVRILKASHPTALLLILISIIILLVKIIISTLPVTTNMCIALDWLGHIGFIILILCLFHNSNRVGNAAIIRPSIHRPGINFSFDILVNRCKKVGIGLLPVICLSIITIFGKQQVECVEELSENIPNLKEVYCECGHEHSIYSTWLYIMEIVVIVAAMRNCWVNRNVPDAFQELKKVTAYLHVLLFLCAMAGSLAILSLNMGVMVKHVLTALAFLLSAAAVVAIIFFPKFHLIFNGADLDDNFTIIQSDRPRLSRGAGFTVDMLSVQAFRQSFSVDRRPVPRVSWKPSAKMHPEHVAVAVYSPKQVFDMKQKRMSSGGGPECVGGKGYMLEQTVTSFDSCRHNNNNVPELIPFSYLKNELKRNDSNFAFAAPNKYNNNLSKVESCPREFSYVDDTGAEEKI